MRKPLRTGVERARSQLPALLEGASKGRSTIITRHGKSIAAIVPIEQLASHRQKALLSLAGSGKGFWGRDSAKTIKQLRREWSR